MSSFRPLTGWGLHECVTFLGIIKRGEMKEKKMITSNDNTKR
jgi:hypothetical protein